jgi:hypothetical protein
MKKRISACLRYSRSLMSAARKITKALKLLKAIQPIEKEDKK